MHPTPVTSPAVPPVPPPLARLARGLVAILAAATVTAWCQYAAVGSFRTFFGLFRWKWGLRDQLFLSGAGYILLLAALGLLPLLVYLLWPRRFTFAALLGTLGGIGAFCVLVAFERIHWGAWMLVSVGIGMQVGRLAAQRTPASWRWTWRLALAGNLATLIAVLIGGRSRSGAEASALAALPPARAGAPNVLLLVMDTERAQSMSLYGEQHETTPHQAAWARRQGVVFDAAYSTAPWTLPSHASMFTGRYASQTGADWTSPMDTTPPTLAEAFRGAGYATAGFVANIAYTGFHTQLGRGFIHYEDTKRSLGEVYLGTTLSQTRSLYRARNTWEATHWPRRVVTALWPISFEQPSTLLKHDQKSVEQVTSDFLRWLPERDARPFFAFINIFDAHDPYLPPDRYRTMFNKAARSYDRYLGAIRYIDDTVETLLQELQRRGVLDNTIVVITSDHGDLFGEHGLYRHGIDPYRELVRIPLVVLNAPGAVPGLRVKQAVSLRDLAATILDLSGVPNSSGIPGTSLRPLLAGDSLQPAASVALSELSPHTQDSDVANRVPVAMKSLADDSSHMIANAEGKILVFAYPQDTAEASDLAVNSTVRQEATDRLRDVMKRLGISWDTPPEK